jgi:hypothetical protein
MEHEDEARKLERETEKLQEHSDEVGERIEETRREWEAKEQDPSVPGAQPEESDQLPEEGPAGQVPDDTGRPGRKEAEENAGVPGEEGTATGNPAAAGSDE